MKSTGMRRFLFPKKKKAAGEKKTQKTHKKHKKPNNPQKHPVVWLQGWELNRSCLRWLNKDTLLSFGSNAASQAEGKQGYTYSEPAKLL